MSLFKLLHGVVFTVVSGFAGAAITPIGNDQNCNDVGHYGVKSKDQNAGTIDRYVDKVSGYFNEFSVNLEELGYLLTEWDRRKCLLDDGQPVLSALLPGYKSRFKVTVRENGDWSKIAHLVKVLKERYPKAPFSASAEVQYWIDYAWVARGSGYASTVTIDGWKLFRERLEQAERILKETKPYAATWPHWYEQMIEIQVLLDRSKEERDRTFQEGAKRFPTYYPIYFRKLWFAFPHWGGSWDEIDRLASWAVKNTESTEGKALYARIYWGVAQAMRDDERLFKTSRADWGKMREGFEDLMRRTPRSSWNLNHYAQFACEAGDAKTFLSLRKRLGENVLEEAWLRGYSLELCEAKFGL